MKRAIIAILAWVGGLALLAGLTLWGATAVLSSFDEGARAQRELAAFLDWVDDRPGVDSASGKLGLADTMVEVEDSVATVVLADGWTVASVLELADDVRAWITDDARVTRVHPVISFDGSDLGVSTDQATTEERMALIERGLRDDAIAGVSVIYEQRGDDYYYDTGNEGVNVEFTVEPEASVAAVYRDWRERLDLAAARLTVGDVVPEDSYRSSGETLPGVRRIESALSGDPARVDLAAMVETQPGVDAYLLSFDEHGSDLRVVVSAAALADLAAALGPLASGTTAITIRTVG